MNLQSWIFPIAVVVIGLVLYHMFVAKALKISAYEQAYERNPLAA